MSRRSRHGRRPQTNTASPAPEPEVIADRPRAATATASFPDGLAIEDVAPVAAPVVAPPVLMTPLQGPPAASAAPDARTVQRAAGEPDAAAQPDADANRTTCTQAQLRRFIKSRPWIPMHELRRRFGIYGGDDDVTPIRVGNGTIFVGLPGPEGRMLGELLCSGDVGYELSLDPGAPIVVGVYPMRPVPRS